MLPRCSDLFAAWEGGHLIQAARLEPKWQQSESNPNEPNRDWRPQQSEANPGDQFRSPQSPNNFWRESRGFNGPDTGNRRDSRNFNEGQRVNRGDFISPGQINPQSDRDMRPNNFDGQNGIRQHQESEETADDPRTCRALGTCT